MASTPYLWPSFFTGTPAFSSFLRALPLLVFILFLPSVPTMAATTIILPTLMDGLFAANVNTEVTFYALGLSYAARAPAGSIVTYSVTSTWGASSAILDSYSTISTTTNATALFGPAGTIPFNILQDSLPADSNLLLFSPLAQPMWTSPAKGNAYLPFVMFTMPSEGSQAAALVAFFASFLQFPLKQLIVTTSSNGIGNAAYAVLTDLLKRVDVTLSRATSASQYTSMVASAPQLIYMVGQTPSDSEHGYFADSSTWATNVLTDKTLGAANTSLGFTFEMLTLVLASVTSTLGSTAPAKGSGVLPQNEFHTSPFPGSTSTEYQVSTDFQAAQGTSTSPAWAQNAVMAGWLYGTALMTSLTMYSGPPATSRETYFDNFVAAQSGFLVSDLFIGSYGPSSTSCSSLAEAHGAVCACHQAGVNTFMSTFTRSGSTYDTTGFPNFVFQYGLSGCGSIYPVAATSEPHVKFLQSLFRQQLIGFNTQDNTEVSSMCDEVMQGLSSFGHVVTSCISTTSTSAGTALGTQLSTYVTNGLMGVIPDAAVASASLGSTFVLDFIPETTQPLVSQANLVYLFSTLDQELYVLASYLLGILTPTSVVCGVVGSSSSADATVALLSKTLTTFTITTEAGNVQKLASGSLGSSIPVGCTHTFVIGVGTGDAAGILTYLQTNADAKVMMSFDDLTKWYSAFQSALSGAPSSVTNRLIFATSLPSWTDMSETFGSLTVPANLPATPAAVRAYIVGLVYTTLCAGASWGSMSSVQAALYASRVLNAGNMKFGPFTTSLSDGSESLQNYGAQGISVWSYTRVTTPTTGTLTAPSVPAMHYFAGATTGSVVDVVKAANGENCVVAPDGSSSLGNTPVVTTAPEPSATPPGGSSTTKLPSPGSTNNGTEKKESSSSHESDALEYVMAILAVLILVFVVLIVLLHLVKRGAFAWLSECMTSMLCSEPLMKEWKDAEKVRAAIDKDRQVDVVQQGVARDPSQAPVDGLLTFVFVEVEQWRELWLGQAEVMARAVRHLHGCVRGAVARNHCYEMQTVEGMFAVACSSAEAGLEVACCIVKEAAELLQRDADVVSAVYAALKCNPGGVRGLRLRVAVHHGTAMKSVDARGRVQWTGGAVDRVVSAAYEAGSAGVVLVTAAAVAALADAGCQRRDEIVPLKRTDAAGDSSCDTDLYVLNVLPGAVCRTEKPSVATGVEASVARAIVTAGAAHGQHSAAVAVCTKRFDAYFGSLSDGERSRSLRWIPRCCGLLVASRDECASDHEYYAELQTCVSRHVASLLECLHHASRGSSLSWKPSSDGRGLEGAPSVTQKSNVAGVVERVAIQSERRVRRSANRVHFSYDGEHADLEDTREMEN